MVEAARTTLEPRDLVFDDWKDHNSAKRTNTELFNAVSFRKHHPDSHITVVDPDSVDLKEWAKAGHAKLRQITERETFLATRVYTAPESRLAEGEGKLDDDIDFAQYELEWENEKILVYQAQWEVDSCYRSALYLLTPRTDIDDEGHSPLADRLIKTCGKWSAALHDEIYVFDQGYWSKSTSLWEAVQSSSWDDVIIDPATKHTIVTDVTSFFESRSTYEEYGVPWKRGIILHGPPGCGKTVTIKALMKTLYDSHDVASLYVKSFETNDGAQYGICSIFEQARSMAPCLLIFEDIDSLIKDETRSYFLNEVDGVQSNDGILMVASTNHLDKLDAAISKRPSRFDRKYRYSLPAEKERWLYCQYWQAKMARKQELQLDDEISTIVAKLTEGFSFAYMKELFVQVLLAVVRAKAGLVDDDVEFEVVDDEKDADSKKVTTDPTEALKKVSKSVKAEDKAKDDAKDAKGKDKGEDDDEGDDDEEEDGDEDKAKADEPKPEPHKIPEVDIPEHLASNPFLSILLKQIVILVKDMDNTADDVVKARPKVW